MDLHDVQAVILAAGKSSRFNTGRSKLLEKICGQEMILYLTKLFAAMRLPTIAVVGFQKEVVCETIKNHHGDTVTFITQQEQRGTGHALLCTKDSWQHDTILVVNGDIPLITEEILQRLYQKHQELNAAISIVLAHQADQSVGAYGRLVQSSTYMEIVEANDFKGDPAEHCLINAGIYLINKKFLLSAINEVQQHHISKEFYIVNLVKIASQAGFAVGTAVVPFDQVRGINTIEELWTVEQIKKAELIKHWMQQGVRFYATHNLHLDVDVTIGTGSEIGCGVHLIRGTSIGKNCKINEYVSIYASSIGDNVTVYPFSMITDTTIGDHARIGPFAHLRAHTKLDAHVAIGNFVEVKNSTINAHTQARHLSYLGDAQIGSGVNIGAGTITCNFDGFAKNTTTIKDNVFVGSNNTLVAPVTIHQNAFTAAGSVITDDVPENTLALGRARQVNKEGYAHTLRMRLGSEEPATFAAASTDKQDHTNDV
jgi:bifunctional UDP-N-acetylglucosamine pyrophosphorylase/glucosamine-1-phosphate N-acetyltransferase